MVCLALELVGPWVVLVFSVGMEAFDELLSLNVPWSQVFYDVLRIPACGFQSYFYSTIDKTSRLKMKCFSTVRDTQRGSELHGEEKREEGVRGDPNEMKWNQKRREQAS